MGVMEPVRALQTLQLSSLTGQHTSDDTQTDDDVASPDTPNVIQAMIQFEQAKTRAKTVNKVVLDTEKEKDAVEKEVEELKRQM